MEVILKKIYFQKSSVFFFQENFLSKIIKVLKISVSSVAEDYVYSQTYINLAPCLKWLVFKFLICFLPKTL